MDFSQKNFWPYDELTFLREGATSFKISTPWLTLQFEVDAAEVDRAAKLSEKINSQSLGAEDLPEINWLMNSFVTYAFAYILPRPILELADTHELHKSKLTLESPFECLKQITANSNISNEVSFLTNKYLSNNWTWDTEAVLNFSQTQDGHDPESIFSVCRRFHLLNDLENNCTGEMFEILKGFSADAAVFKKHSALVMRQNHYITQKCEWVLNGSFDLAQNAKSEVEEFVLAEKGHDKILDKALTSMGYKADQVKALNSTVVLMELFYLIARRNFLAFSMVVDIFERTSYMENDPFAKVLTEGGESSAASKIETHREINDMGGHENVAIGFLSKMKAVSPDYATEAIRLAELLTLVVHLVSRETIDEIKAN